jgi:hypothetical protein
MNFITISLQHGALNDSPVAIVLGNATVTLTKDYPLSMDGDVGKILSLHIDVSEEGVSFTASGGPLNAKFNIPVSSPSTPTVTLNASIPDIVASVSWLPVGPDPNPQSAPLIPGEPVTLSGFSLP